MSTLDLIAKLWPVIVWGLLVVAGVAVALYRLRVLNSVVFEKDGRLHFHTRSELTELLVKLEEALSKDINGVRRSLEKDFETVKRKTCSALEEVEKMEEAVLTEKQHDKLCEIAHLELARTLDERLMETKKELSEMMAASNAAFLKSLQESQQETLKAIRGIVKNEVK